MPVLSQCVPTLDFKSDEFKQDENVEGLRVIRDYMDTTAKLFKNELMGVPEFLKPLKAKEKEYILRMWSEFEYIPDEFRKSFVPFAESGVDYSGKLLYEYQSAMHVEGVLSEYPITNLKNIVSLADKLNMIIVSLDYVDLKNILKSLNIYDSYYAYYESEHVISIKYCRELLSKLGEKHSSELYILSPLSYYNFWNEIKSDKVVGKYYPDIFESIFTTIDLMIPTQRNLFKMSQANNDNNKMLMKSLGENIDVINRKLRQLENRVSNVEAQMEEIKENQRKQAEEARQIKAELKRTDIRYSSLNPLIFFVEGSPVDFFNKKEENRKAHLVTCFGPEFPVEFFTMNGITVYHKNDITIRYPSIYTSYAKKRYY